jgi:hypothetical protein
MSLNSGMSIKWSAKSYMDSCTKLYPYAGPSSAYSSSSSYSKTGSESSGCWGPLAGIRSHDFAELCQAIEDPNVSDFHKRRYLSSALGHANHEIARIAHQLDYWLESFKRYCRYLDQGTLDVPGVTMGGGASQSAWQSLREFVEYARSQEPHFWKCIAWYEKETGNTCSTNWLRVYESVWKQRETPVYLDAFCDENGRANLEAFLLACPEGKPPRSKPIHRHRLSYPTPSALKWIREYVDPKFLERLGLERIQRARTEMLPKLVRTRRRPEPFPTLPRART